MATFPSLSTGAITQYPAPLITALGVQVIRFMDGTDQRYLTQGRTVRSWRLHLDLLNETEVAEIESFFSRQSGDYMTFEFIDPFTGSLVPNCRLANAELLTTYSGVDDASVTLWVVESV